MKKQIIFASAILGAFLLSCKSFALASENNSKPNFLLLIADDSTPGDYGCYGNKIAKTPNIDSLAKNGMMFTRAFVTASSCSPSRTSISTGVYPSQLGLARNLHVELDASSNLTTLQAELSKGGYYTGIAGKTHIGSYALSQFEVKKPFNGKDPISEKTGGAHDFLPMLQERPKDRPFFFWFASTDPHRPFTAPDYAQQYNTADMQIPQFWMDTPETREDLRQHYGEIARFDKYIGDIVAELKKQGVFENTLIIYLADNARPFPRYKTTNYDTGTNVPFIVVWQGRVLEGSVSKELISSIDIAPTFMELAGLRTPAQFEGKSFAKIFKDPNAEIRKYVFSERNWHGYKGYERAVRDKKYSYIRNYLPNLQTIPPGDITDSDTFKAILDAKNKGVLIPTANHSFLQPRSKEEFYDLEKDPLETTNLADDANFSALKQKYSDVLDDWMKSTNQSFDESVLLEDWYDRNTFEANENRKKRILVPMKDYKPSAEKPSKKKK